MVQYLKNKSILITGGTGSLGTELTKRLLSNNLVSQITIFSRDEAKQANLKILFNDKRINYVIGDISCYQSVVYALRGIDVVINCAALKRVEVCERFPDEAVKTNYIGISNIVRAIREYNMRVDTVLNIGSDKGAHPYSVYGVTKFLQEARTLCANNEIAWCRFIGVRYGNVMASRGSVIPIWLNQVASGGPVTVTDPEMTRYLISLDHAVDTIFTALNEAERGEVYIPQLLAARIGDMAEVISNNIRVIGKGIAEKMHETLITKEEAGRTVERGEYYVISPTIVMRPAIKTEYVSNQNVLNKDEITRLFAQQGYIKIKGG